MDAILFMKGSDDSLKVKVIIEMNRIELDAVNEVSFTRTVKIVNENDTYHFKEDWIKAKKIDLLKFTDFKGKERFFVTRNYAKEINKIDDFNYLLYEQLYTGKISWYRNHWTELTTDRRISRDYFIKEDLKKPIPILFTTHEKQLLKLTKDRPDLTSKIIRIETDEDILEILELYNKEK